jgi:PAS domain S-box-containing protein
MSSLKSPDPAGKDKTRENSDCSPDFTHLQDQFLQLIDLLPLVFFEIDLNGRITRANQSAFEKFGYTREEFTKGLHACEILHESESDRIRRNLAETVKGLGPRDEEYLARHKNGSKFPVRIRCAALIREGKIAGSYGILEDISEKKRAEDTLRIQLAAMETSIDGMAIIRSNGCFMFINKAFAEIFGYKSNQDLIGKSWDLLYDKEMQTLFKETVIPAIRKEGNWRGHATGRRLNGETFHQEISLTSIHGGWFIGVVRDITSKTHAEESLRESEEKFRKISEAAQDAIIMLDGDGNVSYWNEAAENIFGYSREEIFGRDCHLLLAPSEYQKNHITGFNQFRKTGEGRVVGKTSELKAIRKDGAVFPMELSVSAVKIQGSYHAIGIMRDISDRRKMEGELIKAGKLESLGGLAGGIAHDFNNILTGIMGSIYMAKYFSKPGEKVHSLLGEAEKAVFRAKDLSQQLLTFAKGGMPIKEVFSLGPLLKSSTMYALRGLQITSQLEISDDLWDVEVDSTQISQVFDNLISNAIRSMPGGGNLTVSGRNLVIEDNLYHTILPGRYVEVSITDAGCGIPEENIMKVFDPFFSTFPGGNGLGLTIAYSIMKKHDGHIEVSSTPERGSTFKVYLKASEKILESKAKNSRSGELIRGSGRILVMEDEEIVRTVLKEYIEELGYDVDFALDGFKAVDLYRQAMISGQPYIGVIMDLTIKGGMGGQETIKILLQHDPDVKVIVSSGYSQDPVLADFRSYGFSGMIKKPYQIDDLSWVIHDVISNRE